MPVDRIRRVWVCECWRSLSNMSRRSSSRGRSSLMRDLVPSRYWKNQIYQKSRGSMLRIRCEMWDWETSWKMPILHLRVLYEWRNLLPICMSVLLRNLWFKPFYLIKNRTILADILFLIRFYNHTYLSMVNIKKRIIQWRLPSNPLK